MRPLHTSLTGEKRLFKQSSSSLAASWSTVWSADVRHGDNHSTPDGVATWRRNVCLEKHIQLLLTWVQMLGPEISQCLFSPLTTQHIHHSTSLLCWWEVSKMLHWNKSPVTQSLANKADCPFVFHSASIRPPSYTVVQMSTDCKHTDHKPCLIHFPVFTTPEITLTTAPALCRPGLHIPPHINAALQKWQLGLLSSKSPQTISEEHQHLRADPNTTLCGPSGPVALTPHKAPSMSPWTPWEIAEV